MQPNFLGNLAYSLAGTLRVLLCAVLLWAGGSGQAAFSPPPAGLTVQAAGPQSVTLAWNAAAGAASYRVYRSTLSGRGYFPIVTQGARSGLNTFTDTNLTNGVSYFYVVTTLDAQGEESSFSNEASGIPHVDFVDVWGSWERTVKEIPYTYTLSSDAPLVFKGEFFITGETGTEGPAQGVSSQLGIGREGVPPAQWSRWFDARYQGYNQYNYDLVQAVVQPADFPYEAGVNTYFYSFRFSTNGKDWLYAGPNGKITNPNTFYENIDSLGSINILSATGSLPPASPVSVAQDVSSGLKPNLIRITWSPPPGQNNLLFYDIFRSDTLTGTANLVSRVAANEHAFLDNRLVAGSIYFYTVRAVNNGYNYSPPSSPVLEAHTAPRLIQVTINVTLPSFTPADRDHCASITRFINPLDPSQGFDSSIAMAYSEQANTCTLTLTGIPSGQYFPFRFTRGDGHTIQTIEDGNGLLPDPGPSFWAGQKSQLSTSETYHFTVDNWDDPLAVEYSPVSLCAPVDSPVSIHWNQSMDPATTFSVEDAHTGQPISGTFAYHPATRTVTFLPAAPYPKDHTFRVTVQNITDLKGIPQSRPLEWTFSTGECQLHLPAVFY